MISGRYSTGKPGLGRGLGGVFMAVLDFTIRPRLGRDRRPQYCRVRAGFSQPPAPDESASAVHLPTPMNRRPAENLNTITAPGIEVSGQQGLAIQLIDQSPIAFDDVVFRDLVAAHATQTDQQVLYGSGANGQVLGVLETPNIQSVAIASLDIRGVYAAIANAIQLVHATRFQLPEVIVMHPRHWGWLLSLAGPAKQVVVPARRSRCAVQRGGHLGKRRQSTGGRTSHGLPVVTDPNITTTAGTGGNENQILVCRGGCPEFRGTSVAAR